MSLQNMPSSSNLIMGIIGEILRIGTGKGKGKALIEVLLSVLVVAVIVAMATAPFKILLRKNFGPNAISVADIIFGAVYFGLWAFISFLIWDNSYYTHQSGIYSRYLSNSYGLFIITLILSTITIVTVIKGFKEEFRSRFRESEDWISENYRGYSLLFEKYITNNKMQYKVWKNLEPRFCFKWSFLFLIIHPLLGFPMLFASVAFWVNEWYHVKYKWERLSELNSNPKFKDENSFANGNIVSA